MQFSSTVADFERRFGPPAREQDAYLFRAKETEIRLTPMCLTLRGNALDPGWANLLISGLFPEWALRVKREKVLWITGGLRRQEYRYRDGFRSVMVVFSWAARSSGEEELCGAALIRHERSGVADS